MTPEQEIYENAVRVMEGCGPLSGLRSHFGYNRESVEWLDGYIERLCGSGQFSEEEQVNNLVVTFGCFLGQCMRATYGGAWREQNGAWGIFFSDSRGVFPFSKVRKQFDYGRQGGDSILHFFDFVPEFQSGSLDQQQAASAKESRTVRFLAILRRMVGR